VKEKNLRRVSQCCSVILRDLPFVTERARGARLREEILTFECEYVQLNMMRSRQLHDALEKLTKVIREVEAVVETMRAEHDPLASHIFVSRRSYRNVNDTKSGKRRDIIARLSFNTACELGFRGSLDEWDRLMGAVARR
jgi:hypothetical protein